MSVDPVFPLPSPDFLWVHSLIRVPSTAASAVVDAEGHWHYETGPSAAFMGYLTAPNPKEVERAATTGFPLDAVALAPHGTAVAERDRLIAANIPGGEGPWLDGDYEVALVRPNKSHLRLLLTRLRLPDQPTVVYPQHGWNGTYPGSLTYPGGP